MTRLTPKTLKNFLSLTSEKLNGDWLLVGDTLLPALGLNVRATIDIDFVSLSGTQDQTLELMSLAEELELPIDCINQAAAFFVRKTGVNKKDLILLKKGKRATIYRPSLELYWKLKLSRMSETDLQDCEHYYHYCHANNEVVDITSLLEILNSFKAKSTENSKLQRLLKLERLLAT